MWSEQTQRTCRASLPVDHTSPWLPDEKGSAHLSTVPYDDWFVACEHMENAAPGPLRDISGTPLTVLAPCSAFGGLEIARTMLEPRISAWSRSSAGLEHLPSKQRVAGSNPAGIANEIREIAPLSVPQKLRCGTCTERG